MADMDDAAKAEKLAAAKKRFEELKKKKGKKGGKAAAASSKSDRPAESVPEEPAKEETGSENTPEETAQSEKQPASEELGKLSSPPPAVQSATVHTHSRRISTSGLRRPSVSAADIIRSRTKSPLSPTDVPDIYRRQAETISGLTEENGKLIADIERLQTKEKRVTELEAEKDELMENLSNLKEEVRGLKGRIDVADEVKKKSDDEIEKMKSKTAALNRQMSHLTSQTSAKDKTISDLRLRSSASSGSEDKESLIAKENQIENMEMEISKLRNMLERVQKSLTSAEDSLKTKETAYNELREEYSKTQVSLEAMQSKLTDASELRSSMGGQIIDLQKELDDLKSEDKTKSSSILSLEKDYNTLKSMYRDSEAKSQESVRMANINVREMQELEDELVEQRKKAGQMEAENEYLRLKLERAVLESRKLTGANPNDDREVDDLEDAERERLRNKVHSLEEALTNERRQSLHQRNESITSASGFLDDDDDVDFGELLKKEMEANRIKEMEKRQREADAEAERRRQEQERLERVREAKRALEKWRGWRMDMTLIGGCPAGLGEMFEV